MPRLRDSASAASMLLLLLLLHACAIAAAYTFKRPNLACAPNPIDAGCCPEVHRVRKPNPGTVPAKKMLIGIGCGKCGTTYLYSLLARHPSFRPPLYKELHFFSAKMGSNTSLTLEDYLKHWPDIEADGQSDDLVFFEFSSAYYMDVTAPCRMRQWLPDAKAIMILRDPTARAYSAVDMYRRLCLRDNSEEFCHSSFDFQPFSRHIARAFNILYNNCPNAKTLKPGKWTWNDISACWQGEPHELLTRGLYASKMAWWLEFYPPEQLMILNAHELWRDPVPQLNKIVEFMGLDIPFTDKMIAANKGSKLRVNPSEYIYFEPELNATIEELRKFFVPHNQDLYDLLEENNYKFSPLEFETPKNGPAPDVCTNDDNPYGDNQLSSLGFQGFINKGLEPGFLLSIGNGSLEEIDHRGLKLASAALLSLGLMVIVFFVGWRRRIRAKIYHNS